MIGKNTKAAGKLLSAPNTPPPFEWGLLAPKYWMTWTGMFVLWQLTFAPQRLRVALGSVIGGLMLRVLTKKRRVAARNIECCFPELSASERAQMVRAHFCAASATFLTSSLFWWGSPSRLSRLVRYRNREFYDRVLAAGRPVILLAPHFVTLEVAGVLLSRERPMVSMYRRSPNAVLEWVMTRARGRFGGEMFERDGSLKRLISSIRKGLPFYYLPDRNPGDASHVFAPFFGHPAATVNALERIAELAHAEVIPCATRLLPGGQGYEIIFRPAMKDIPAGDAVAYATRMNAEIESLIREMPEQYMWTYKRFKIQPPGTPPFYG